MTTNQTPSGPSGLPVLGNTHQWLRDPFEFRERCAEEYGRVVNFEIVGTDTYMLTDPADVKRVLEDTDTFPKGRTTDNIREIVGNGLVTSEGESWERQREAIQPAFYMSHIKNYADIMVSRTQDTLDGWRDGTTVNLHDEMLRTSLEISIETMFGEDIDLEARGIHDAAEDLQAPLKPQNQLFTFFAPDWAPVPVLRRADRAYDHLEALIYDILDERRGADTDREDLLAMLLDSDVDMADELIRDEMLTFLIAGHETIAVTMTGVWDLLSRNPEAEARLHEELDDVVDGRPTIEDVFEFEYTEAVVNETMRLYPAAHELRRETAEDVTFGDYEVPEGSLVVLPMWVLHRDERFWDDPETFRPERFLEDDRDRPEYAFFPFGGGPRRCIGNQFGMTEAQLMLATIASEWTLDRNYDDLEFAAGVTLLPKGDLPVTTRRR